MKQILKALIHPLTLINGLFVGVLILVGIQHNTYHHDMEKDADSFVFQWCRVNPEKCDSF